MSSLNVLETDLFSICNQLKSDKVLVRLNAFKKLDGILFSRQDEIHTLFEKSKLNWTILLNSAHEGLLLHANKLNDTKVLHENDSKSITYMKVVEKIVETAYEKSQEIQNKVIIGMVMTILDDTLKTKVFGNHYLTMLQKNILRSKTNVIEIKVNEWSRILSYCFKLLDCKNHSIDMLSVASCTASLIEVGTTHSQLGVDLYQYLPSLIKLVEDFSGRTQIEIVKICYLCCKNLVANYRFALCSFTESIMGFVIKSYQGNHKSLDDTTKTIFFKFMDLSIIIHTPNLSNDREKLQTVIDNKEWYSLLRNLLAIVENELSVATTSRSISQNSINPILIQFAARLCYLAYWENEIWEITTNIEGTQSAKRLKKVNKLQTIIDHVSKGNSKSFNWKWLLVLGELVSNYPEALISEDVMPLLTILSQFQPTIDNSIQVYALAKCCLVLLKNEIPICNDYVNNYNEELWNNIAEGAFRLSTSNSKLCIEYHILLQVLIKHRKYPSSNFILDVINTFLTNSTKRTDITLSTLITILESFNLDSLENSALCTKILNYLFEKPNISQLKNVIMNVEKINSSIIGQLTVICCLSKTDVFNFKFKSDVTNYFAYWKLNQLQTYKAEMDKTVHLILLKSLEKLLIEDDNFLNGEIQENLKSIPVDLKCIIDEPVLKSLSNVIPFNAKEPPENADPDAISSFLQSVLEHSELLANILNQFLQYEALNRDKFRTSPVRKEFLFRLQQLELLFEKIKRSKLEFKDTLKLLQLVKTLVNTDFHPVISEMIRTFDLKNMLSWVQNQIINEYNLLFTKSLISLENFVASKIERRIKYQALEILVLYLHYDGTNTEYVVEELSKVSFEISDNVECHTVLHLIKLLGQHKNIHPDVATWIIRELQEVCTKHHQNPYVSNCIVERIFDVMKLSKGDIEISENTIMMVQSFAKKCVQKHYSPQFCVAFLDQMKSFHTTFFHLVDNNNFKVNAVYAAILNLLYTPFLEIKLAAIKCLSFILKTEMGNDFSSFECRNSSKTIKLALYDSINLNDLDDPDEELDGKTNTICASMQLFSSAFSVNYNLRKKILIDMTKFCINKGIEAADARQVFEKVMIFLKSDSDNFMDSRNVLNLMCLYLKEQLHLSKIPFYFTTAKSHEDFFLKYYNIVVLAIMKTNVSLLKEFVEKNQIPLKDAILKVFPECLTYLLPYQSHCQGIEYSSNATEMNNVLKTCFTSDEMKSHTKRFYKNTCEKLLMNVYDQTFFEQLCDFRFDMEKEEDFVDLEAFRRCLEHLKKDVFKVSLDSTSFLTILCQRSPSDIESLLINCKTRVQETMIADQKLHYLLQYCVLVHELHQYLGLENLSENVKGFLIRDILHFLCCLIFNESEPPNTQISCIAINFLKKFIDGILPLCAEYLKPFLNHVVYNLTSICKLKTSSSTIVEKCMKVLNLLIVIHQNHLKDEIAKLDNFPADKIFNDLRVVHHTLKYNGKEFTLIEEVEHFLSMDKRKIEGLISLRENLSIRKSELIQLYNALHETKCFSEDGEKSLLHKLVQVLIAHINGVDEQKAIEAVKCLGEIGAYDLATMVFESDASSDSIYHEALSSAQVEELAVKTALEKLNLLLVHFHPKVFQPVSAACYHLLSKEVGKKHPFIYLNLFMIRPKESNETVFINPCNLSQELNLLEIFTDEENSNYSCFIQRICCALFTYLGDKVLQCVSAVQVSFAEKMVPMLIQVLLSYESSTLNQKIVETVNYFFEESSEKQKSTNPLMKNSIFLNKFAIKILLNMAECVRIHRQNFPSSKFPIDLLHLNIAKAARYCGAHFTAVIYCELYARKRLEIESQSFETTLSNINLCDIMNEAYLTIGLRDAHNVFVNPIKSRLNHLQMQPTFTRSLLELDATNHLSKDLTEAFRANLMESGMYSMARKIPSEEPQYECLWRLGDWSALIDADSETVDCSKALDLQVNFEKYHYSALKCLKNLDELGTKTAISRGRKTIVQMLKRASLQCTKNLYKFLNMSQRMQQIEDYYPIQFRLSQQGVELDAFNKWKSQDQIPYSDFQNIESVLAQRNSIFHTAGVVHARKFIPEAIQVNTLFIIKEAIKSAQHNVAIRNIATMKSHKNLIPDLEAQLLIEDSRVSWQLNDTNLAKQLLQKVINEPQFKDLLIKSQAFRLHGEYLGQSHAETIDKINESYFMQSLKYLELYAQDNGKSNLINTKTAGQHKEDKDESSLRMRKEFIIYETIAKYADREYIQINKYVQSLTFEDSKKTLEKSRNELFSIDRRNVKTNDIKAYVISNKINENDKKEMEKIVQKRDFYASRAMKYYLFNAITNRSANVFTIFRITSLWLSNPKNANIIKYVEEKLQSIPSYMFLQLLPQLTARLTEKKDLLSKLLERCTLDHPHHAMSLIMALVKSNDDNPNKNAEVEPRILGAQQLLDQLKNIPNLKKTIQQCHNMSDALINLANQPKIIKIAANDQILKIRDYDAFQCPTVPLEVALDCNYKNQLVTVIKYARYIEYVGGVTAPKKIKCVCSDGKTRLQLIKGGDDLRQDAVMQQVFGMVNQTLKDHPATKKRHLNIRTYKVIALTRRCGVIEFCDDAISLGNYLIGDSSKIGAHRLNRPKDWSPQDCRKAMQDIDKESQECKQKTFDKICSNIQPVFHHFFYEKFQRPGVWFERRLAYLSSVAVSSMVGYILGIGDRHVQNILIDTNTAEVIHIDFGIAFEQGKILPHPETIPFRLTRDIVSPMGITGVNGLFRKTCEKTLEVLRENQTQLLTILEVLLYDPLYVWTMSSEKVQKHQREEEDKDVLKSSNGLDYVENEKRNLAATRVLARVQAKLEGQELERISYSSVEGQVESLIQSAMNPMLLSRLFAGWQPFL